MVENLTYDQFCSKYYLEASKAVDITETKYIANNGGIHRSIDMDFVKSKTITEALRKAYDTFDADREKNASIKTYIHTIVRTRFLTEIRNESTAVKAGKKSDIDRVGRKAALADTGEEELDRQERLREMAKAIANLTHEEQIVINCYLDHEREYVDAALDKLGWGEERRTDVLRLKKRAMLSLQKMMVGSPKATKEQQEVPKEERPYYVYDIKLANLKGYVDMYKQYFGLDHPNLDIDLSLLDRNPEKTFSIVDFVRNDDIMTAFSDGNFQCKEEDKQGYVDLLWVFANLYYKDSYQRYQDYYNEEVSDQLIWEEIQDDMLKLYAFIQDHPKKEEVVIKMGGKSVKFDDVDGWFQALLNNHLFPHCLPEFKSKEQALKKMKKTAGRKKENIVATAVINGVARLFEDEGLITGRAPKNLCKFIKTYLILMDVLDGNKDVLSEANIKSSITNFRNQKEDPRLFTPELRTVTLEEMKDSSLHDRSSSLWLFHPDK